MKNRDERIVAVMQGDVPIVPRPFAAVAKSIGVSEEELIRSLQRMKEEGVLRRVGAILNHRKAGVSANVMCVWRVPARDVEKIGKRFAMEPAITHCYERPAPKEFPYNLYTMIHGSSMEECRELIRRLAAETGIADYRMLPSVKEYKKTSFRYYESTDTIQ